MESGNSLPVKPGRKGDPRMHQSVRARLQNPALSLYDALREGGFTFFPRPGTDPDSATEASLCDSDGILLCQRKNQLSRRLRSMRTQSSSSASHAQHNTDDDGESSDLETGATSSVQKYDHEQRHVPSRGGKRKGVGVDEKVSAGPLVNRVRRDVLYRHDTSEIAHGTGNAELARSLHHQSQQSQIDEVISSLFARNSTYMNDINIRNDSNIATSFMDDSSRVKMDILNRVGNYDFHQQPSTAMRSTFVDGSRLPLILNQHRDENVNFSSALSRPMEGFGGGNNFSSQNQPLLNLHAPSSDSDPMSGFILNECRMRSAIDNYRIESGFLLKKCMILAGFHVKQTDETDAAYLTFLETIINYEKRRFGKLQSIVGAGKGAGNNSHNSRSDTSAATSSDMDSAGVREIIEAVHSNHDRNVPHQNLGDLAPWAKYGNNCSKSHDHDHAHSHFQSLPERDPNSSKCKYKGRHVHRLEGKCGHKAVIHKPDGGAPHVDFLVDGKIECYSGVKPTKRDEAAMWPSSYHCDEIMCSKSGCHENYFHRKSADADDCLLGKEIEAPKVLDMSEIHMKSKEWNMNFFNNDDNSIDSTLLGLFNLGDGAR